MKTLEAQETSKKTATRWQVESNVVVYAALTRVCAPERPWKLSFARMARLPS